MSIHPTWATKHKKKGTELRLINGRYYLYSVSSKWDPEKKRAKKITGNLLGKITKEDGFVESEKAKLRQAKLKVKKVVTKEYGISAFVDQNLGEYKTLLKKHFPDTWELIMTLVYGRLVYHSPMKNMQYFYEQSYLSEKYSVSGLSPASLTKALRGIGIQREQITTFFQEFKQKGDNILFDGTDLLTKSRKMNFSRLSKSKRGSFDLLANIMFVFSVGLQLPIYYRLMPGDIKDVKSFKLCLKESNISDAIVIADKGFYSKENVDQLNKENLQFIIPLHRNNKLIDYNTISSGDKNNFIGYFEYQKRIIWYYFAKKGQEQVIVYLDEELKIREIKDYLNRVDKLPEKYDLDTFHKKQHCFGTIALMHNTNKTAQQLFCDYKSRGQIEAMIDTMKNTLDADKSYMQNEYALEAWMFINFIAIHWYYKIYQLLVQNNLISKYSPQDLIIFLKNIKKVKIQKKWHTAEITKKTKNILDKLKIDIT